MGFYSFTIVMKYFKHIWIILFSAITILSLNFGFWLKLLGPTQESFNWNSTPEIDSQEIENINQGSKTFSEKLEWILHLPQKSDYPTSLWYVTSLIQITINWLLWILASVVLVYMLYCGFLILSSWSDDKNVSKGKKWISSAAITIAGIGLSWLVISAMIRFINIISKGSS